jgi:hypothetical protein
MCHSPRSDGSASSDDGNVHVLEQPEFLHIALQISAGKQFFYYIAVFVVPSVLITLYKLGRLFKRVNIK